MSLVTALQCITIATESPQALEGLFRQRLGWELFAEHRVDPVLASQWGISADSAGERACILRSPGSDRGMVRVVAGSERGRSRVMAARWAGVEMVVSRDLDELHDQLQSVPSFRTLVPPSDWDWSEYGSNVHRAFIGIADGGTHLAFTMALTQPQGRRFPEAAARVGHVFDVPLVTSDYAPCRRFYRDVLGMVPILESSFTDHLWHRLWQLPTGSPVTLDIYKGRAAGTGLGGVELQSYPSALVDPEPASPSRLDGGACMVTYTTHDIDAAYAAVRNAEGVRVCSEPRLISQPPYREARMFSLQGPAGERLELVEHEFRAS